MTKHEKSKPEHTLLCCFSHGGESSPCMHQFSKSDTHQHFAAASLAADGDAHPLSILDLLAAGREQRPRVYVCSAPKRKHRISRGDRTQRKHTRVRHSHARKNLKHSARNTRSSSICSNNNKNTFCARFLSKQLGRGESYFSRQK